MKTHFHPKNRLKGLYKGKITFIIALFVVCVLFFSFLDGGLIRISTPVWIGENMLVRGVSNFFKLVTSKQDLISENENLKSKLASDELTISILSASEGQNNLLLETYGRTPKNNQIGATVLSRPPETLFDTLIVDAGESSGVKVGDIVSIPEGATIGNVFEVFSKSSKVRLFSTSGGRVPALFEREAVPAVLLGRGGGTFEASLPRDTTVIVGDRVLSAGFDGSLVGVVENVEVAPTDSFKKVLVRNMANIFNIHFVSISHE